MRGKEKLQVLFIFFNCSEYFNNKDIYRKYCGFRSKSEMGWITNNRKIGLEHIFMYILVKVGIYIFPAMGFADFMLALHLKFAATNVTTN